MAEAPAPVRAGEPVIEPRTTRVDSRGRLRAAARLVLVVLAAEAVILAAWWAYDGCRRGHLVLESNGPPLRVEVLDESGTRRIREPVDLLTTRTIDLSAGDYRLRVSSPGLLSRTYRLAVIRGQTSIHRLSLDEGRLLGQDRRPPEYAVPEPSLPIPYSGDVKAVELTPGRSSLVEWNNRNILLRDPEDGRVIWQALRLPESGGIGHEAGAQRMLWLMLRFHRGTLVQPPPDLNGDGVGDLVWQAPEEPAYLVLSGKDGSILWTYRAELDGPGTPYPDGPRIPDPKVPASRGGIPWDMPSAVDLDHDGTPDLLATLAFDEFSGEKASRARTPSASANDGPRRRRIILAISGRRGTRLWSHPIDADFMPSFLSILWSGSARYVPGGRVPFLGLVDQDTWRGLDPATGKPVHGPIVLGVAQSHAERYADLDGDGPPELIVRSRGSTPTHDRLSAYAIATGRQLWNVLVPVDRASHSFRETGQWPWIVDPDGDGRSELAVPEVQQFGRGKPGAVGIQVLDGASGRRRWFHPLRITGLVPEGLGDLVEAPDLDGDGLLDLVVTSWSPAERPGTVTSWSATEWFYVDAISGKDGRSLWWWRTRIPAVVATTCGSLLWWGRGPDGWPLLAVPVEPRPSSNHPLAAIRALPRPPEPVVWMLEASTGRVVGSIDGWTNVAADDLDGDGLPDLWGRYQGELRAYRGQAPETWRALGDIPPARAYDAPAQGTLTPAADLDGDGIADALTWRVRGTDRESDGVGSRTAIARSGRDGRILWTAPLDARAGWFDRDRGEMYVLRTFPLPAGDFDGDGTADVLVRESAASPPVQARSLPASFPLMMLSGRTGRQLWIGGALPLAFEAHGDTQVEWTAAAVCEPGAPPDLIVRHRSPFLMPSRSMPTPGSTRQDRLARISGRTGRVVWDVDGSPTPGRMPAPILADLDGDGVDELAALLIDPSGASGRPESRLSVFSLHDGRLLWTQPLGTPADARKDLQILEVGAEHHRALVVVDEFPTVIYTQPPRPGGRRPPALVRAFNGRDGQVLWSWPGDWKDLDDFGRPRGLSTRPIAPPAAGVAVSFRDSSDRDRTIFLDDQGRDQKRLSIPTDDASSARWWFVDLDGDGREEVVLRSEGRFRAFDRDGNELWARPDPSDWLGELIPPAAGRPATLVLSSGMALEATTGRPRWSFRSAVPYRGLWPAILDPGGADGPPRAIVRRPGATVCHLAVATTSDGRAAPGKGSLTPPGLARDDPRWLRPLPWVDPMLHDVGVDGLLVAAASGSVNVVLPITVLWLFVRGRRWTIRLLMLLPIAVAGPLWVFHRVEPMIPAQLAGRPVSPRLLFALATLAGVPLVVFAGSVARNLARRRWRVLAWRVGIAVVAAAIVAAVWIREDLRFMSGLERYDLSAWPLVLIPGAMAAGSLIPFVWVLGRVVGWSHRNRQSEAAQ